MDHGHGGEAATPTTVVSSELRMAGEVRTHPSNGTLVGHLGAFSARRASFAPSGAYHSPAEFAQQVRAAAGRGEVRAAVFHREPRPGVAAAYASIGELWRQAPAGPVDVGRVGLQLPGGVVPVALQPRPGAGRGVALADLLPAVGVGAVCHGDYALQPLQGAWRGEVFVGPFPDGSDYYPLQPRPGAGVLVDLLPGGTGAVYDGSGNFAQQTLRGTGRAEGIVGGALPLGDPDLGAGYDASGPQADDLGGAVHGIDNPRVVSQQLRRLVAFVGIGTSSVAVNGLAAGPGSPAVAFHLFPLLLGGLFLVILHVLHV